MLDVRELTKRFGDVAALDHVTFRVDPGRIVGFLGPNGAGKTTTMRAIFGLLEPDGGELMWRGGRIGSVERQRFGYMPEERGLYPKMKVREQLVYVAELSGLGGRAAKDAATQWLERLELGDRANARVEELSHGNQQRVQLAAALIHGPELAVLDEPFSGLDPLGVDALSRLLEKTAAEGVAVLFSSHQLELVEHVCQDVVIIDRGRIALAGEVNALKAAASYRSLEVVVEGRPWVPDRHVAFTPRTDDRTRLLVDSTADLDAILAEAQRAGEVTRFSFEPPSLVDLFMEAVASEEGRP